MSGRSVALQTAVHGAIAGASIAGVKRVSDHYLTDPGTGDFPFVQIGEAHALPLDVSGSDGAERYIDLHVWSRYRGQGEAKRILDGLRGLFHARPLAVPGLSSAFAYAESERVLSDPDGLTRHGVLTLKILCHEQEKTGDYQ